MDASHPSLVTGTTTIARKTAHPVYTHERGYAMCVGENEDMISGEYNRIMVVYIYGILHLRHLRV